jgi:hypothetical protein
VEFALVAWNSLGSTGDERWFVGFLVTASLMLGRTMKGLRMMNLLPSNPRDRGVTLSETLVALAVCLLLFAVLLPWIARPKPRARHDPQTVCLFNLKQIGLAFRLWSADNGDRYPMSVSTNGWGSLELAGHGEVFRHFLAITNELPTPKLYACPADKQRQRASRFDEFGNSNLSYFVNLSADERGPQSLLSGDRNLTGGVITANRIMSFTSLAQAGWDRGLHHPGGNVGLADGSAQRVSAFRLGNQSTNPPLLLEFP